jgi:SAM-dependent methyltransferase
MYSKLVPMNFRNTLLRSYLFLSSQVGIDPRKMFRFLRSSPRFLRDYYRFRSGYSGSIALDPCFHEWYERPGAALNEYFWQDLLVAGMIFRAKPEKHVDVGSRVDGFVAHVASFREIEVLDIRPVPTPVPGIVFKQADLMKPVAEMEGYCDSLSCLHALEHFGLGRYGDPVDAKGFEHGLANMARLLRSGGVFYLSVPIGIDRVEFNGYRVIDPRIVITLALDHSLRLTSLIAVDPRGTPETIPMDETRLADLARQPYTLGIFTFSKWDGKDRAQKAQESVR